MSGIPSMMRAVSINAFGRAEGMELLDRPLPEPQADEVLIRVAAAGINRPDIFQRQGLYPPPLGASEILGLEASGEVVACGAQVDRWQPGDQVCALLNGGGYAEYAVAPQTQCLQVPDGYDLIEAAALPETLYTVWFNVFQTARLQPGETLLVHAGASGIGTMAIQLAVAMGARVFVTAGSAKKCRLCLDLGAELAIDYTQDDFVDVLHAHTQGQGVDVILDMIGADTIVGNIKLAAMDGRIVMIAFLSGTKATVNFVPLMMKRLTLTGSTLRAQTTEQKARITHDLQQQVFPLLVSGRVKPYIYKIFPFEDVVGAHKLMERNEHSGKLVLKLGS